MSVPAICCVFIALFLIKMLVCAFRFCTVAYTYNWIVSVCSYKIWIVFPQNFELDCHAYALLLKKSLLFSVCSFLIALLLCTLLQPTGAENRYQPVTVITLKVIINNFSKYLALSAYEKNFAEFQFLYIFNSLFSYRIISSISCLVMFNITYDKLNQSPNYSTK